MDWMFVLKLFITLLAVLGATAVVSGFLGTSLAWFGHLLAHHTVCENFRLSAFRHICRLLAG